LDLDVAAGGRLGRWSSLRQLRTVLPEEGRLVVRERFERRRDPGEETREFDGCEGGADRRMLR
jgi:hypothetical protein